MIDVDDLPEQMQAGIGQLPSQVSFFVFLYEWHFDINSYIIVKHKEDEHVPTYPKIDFSGIQFPPDGPESEDDVPSFGVSILHY